MLDHHTQIPTQARELPKKAKARAKAAAAKNGKANAKSNGSGLKGGKGEPTQKKIKKLSQKRGCCFKHQRGTCENDDRQWHHSRALCDSPDCAAWVHKA